MTIAPSKLDELRARAGGTRTITAPLELRDRGDELRIAGTALVYGEPSEDIGWYEVLMPGAACDALAAAADLPLLWSHDWSQPLARRAGGSLTVRDTSRGVEFEATLPATQLARDVVELVRHRVVSGCSFSFTMRGGRDQWEERNGVVWRYIDKIGELRELSLVVMPAYAATDVGARSLDQRVAALRARVERARAVRTRPQTEGDPPVTTPAVRKPPPAAPSRITTTDRDPYGPDSPHSYFRDLATVAAHDQRVDAAISAGVGRATRYVADPNLPAPGARHDGGVDEARARLAGVEERALSDAAGAGGEFLVLHGVPQFVADEWVRSVTATAVVARVLREAPLPETGLQFEAPVFTTGSSAAVQTTEGAADSNTDPATGLVGSELATIAGHVDVSQQLFDRSRPGIDLAIAEDLGRKYGAALDVELLTGPAATSKRLVGLLNVAGKLAYTYTSASPTPAEFLGKLGDCVQQVATLYGDGSGLVALMHPRRKAWVEFKAAALLGNGWPIPIYGCASMPTTLGAGTNEDRVVVLDPRALPIAFDTVKFRATPQAQAIAGTLQVRVQAYGYTAALTTRQPKALGFMSGTGLAAPSF